MSERSIKSNTNGVSVVYVFRKSSTFYFRHIRYRFYSTLAGYFCVRALHQSIRQTLMRRVSAGNTSVNQQHLVKYTQRVYIIVPVKDNCAIYYYFVKEKRLGHGGVEEWGTLWRQGDSLETTRIILSPHPPIPPSPTLPLSPLP